MKTLLWLLCFPILAQAQMKLTPLSVDQKTSIRGLSVVDDQVIWVSGSGGSIGKSTDAGKTWFWTKPAGFEKIDFRDIEAFDENNAIAMGIAAPSYILKTTDGGKSWKEVYKNLDTAMFLDGMDFWDAKRGIAYGDPINGKMQLLSTVDGGESWQNISEQLNFSLQNGEASFAASGTAIRTGKGGLVSIITGGTASNLYTSKNYGKSWQRFPCPILQGQSSTGPFSIAFSGPHGIAVGGDYLKDQNRDSHILLTKDSGKSWYKPETTTLGFRSAVEYISKDNCIATGTSGTDLSEDGGLNWTNLSRLSFNSVRKAKKGSLVVLAGDRGKVYKLEQ